MKYKVGKLYYRQAIKAFLYDIFLTFVGVVGMTLLYLALSGGKADLQGSQTSDGVGLIIGSVATFFAARFLLKRIPDNKFHNISLFVFIGLVATIPAIMFAPGYSSMTANLWGIILFVLLPYAAWFMDWKKRNKSS